MADCHPAFGVTLPYHPASGQVLRGRWRGHPLAEACISETEWLRLAYRHVRVQRVTCRPWWRLWRETPALVLMPLPRQA